MENVRENELLKQLDVLHQEVKSIASQISGLHAVKKGIDKKATVIGRALIEQKKTTEQVMEHQNALVVQMGTQMSETTSGQKHIQALIQDVNRDVRRFRNVEEREDAILKALNRLSTEQTQYMTETQSLCKTAHTDLSTVYEILDQLKQTIAQMDLQNQVEFMSHAMTQIQEHLEQYAEARLKIETAVADRMADTEKQLQGMENQMTEQARKINMIAQIASSYEKKTTEMCEKFDAFLSEMQPETELEDTSLEAMFAETQATETTKTEESFDDDYYYDDEDDTEEIDIMEEYDEDDESVRESVTEDDLHVRILDDDDEPQPKTVPKKKKGFFSRMFGR